MDIQDLAIFVRVAAVQNLSSVAAEMALTAGTISKRIQSLEDELAVRLFERTTRSVRITDEGRQFLDYAERVLREIEQARATIGGPASRPRGKLRVASPSRLGGHEVARLVAQFIDAHPEIGLELDVADRMVSLHEEGYDVAIHAGVLADSTLIAKRLAADPQIVVASPAYLASRHPLTAPEDIERHAVLILGDDRVWPVTHNGRSAQIRVSGRLRSMSLDLLEASAIEGQGLLRISAARAARHLDSGLLVRVLPACDFTSGTAIWAVYPNTRHIMPRLRSFLDFIADALKSNPEADDRRQQAAVVARSQVREPRRKTEPGGGSAPLDDASGDFELAV